MSSQEDPSEDREQRSHGDDPGKDDGADVRGSTLIVHLDAPEGALPTGAIVGRYVILRQLTDAGIGISYAAFDTVRDHKVTLKLIPTGTVPTNEGPSERARLMLHGLERLTTLTHPNVLRVFELGTYDGGVFLATEFMEGITLRRWMEARDEPFPWRQVLQVFREAGRGLAAAHAAGIVHGDFKPDDVLLGKGGRVCVFDFGLANEDVVSDDEIFDVDPHRELAAAVMAGLGDDIEPPALLEGTPSYLAPERHLGAPADAKADQFAYCVSFHEALFGERPFAGDRRSTLALEMLSGRVRAPQRSTVPPWLREVVLRGLSPRRGDRHASMEALLRALDRDPAASRARWMKGLVMLSGVLLLGAGIAYLVHVETTRCEPDASTLLGGVWDASVQHELAQVFGDSRRPHAEASWRTIETHVDEWTREWLELREIACVLTRVRAEASEDLFAQRNACLDGTLAELRGFTRVVAHADGEQIDRAVLALAAIDRPWRCVSAGGLATYARAPEGAEERFTELQAEQAFARATYRSGRAQAAAAEAEGIRPAVFELGQGPLRVAQRLLQARLGAELGGPAAAELAFHDAAAEAEAEGLHRLAAEAWIELAHAAIAQRQPERAELWLRHAAFASARDRDPVLLAGLAEARGRLAAANDRVGDALGEYHEAIALLETKGGLAELGAAPILVTLGRLVAEHDGSAESYFERALRLQEKFLGADHPDLAAALDGLAGVQLAAGRVDEALARLERARVLLLSSERLDDVAVLASVERRLGEAELARGRAPQAAAHFDQAVQHLRSFGPVEHTTLRLVLNDLARAHVQVGRLEDARAALEQALALQPTGVVLAETRELLASVLWDVDRKLRTEARELALLARDAYRVAGKASDIDLARIDGWLDGHKL